MQTLTVFTPAYNRAHTIGLHINLCVPKNARISCGL